MVNSRESKWLCREGMKSQNSKRINCEHYLYSYTTEYWSNTQEMQYNDFRMIGGEKNV